MLNASITRTLHAGENLWSHLEGMKKNSQNSRRTFKPKKRFHGLASFRLHMLSNVSERLIESRYRRKFGLRMVEVGIIAEVGASGPLSFKNTYIQTDLDKGNASRLAARLLENGLLEKREDPADQRSFYLTLTPAGQKQLRVEVSQFQRVMGAITRVIQTA